MRLALLFGLAAAAAAALPTRSVEAQAPGRAKPPVAAPQAAAPQPKVSGAPGSKPAAPPASASGLSARDETAIRDAQARDRRREERMLQVTRSICRGC